MRHPRPVCVDRSAGRGDLERLASSPATVYLSLCFHEELIDPTRPLLSAGCEPVPACEYGRVLRDLPHLRDARPGPTRARRASRAAACAAATPAWSLWRSAASSPASRCREDQLDLGGRRSAGAARPRRDHGINWVHGATYARDDAQRAAREGIEVRLSRPASRWRRCAPASSSLTGVEAGGGRSAGDVQHPGRVPGPAAGRADRPVRLARTTDETLQYGDRVIVAVRGDFIVDECCRAVDGNHLGGGVPWLGDSGYSPIEQPPERAVPAAPVGQRHRGRRVRLLGLRGGER